MSLLELIWFAIIGMFPEFLEEKERKKRKAKSLCFSFFIRRPQHNKTTQDIVFF
jgi:hypothetical protein